MESDFGIGTKVPKPFLDLEFGLDSLMAIALIMSLQLSLVLERCELFLSFLRTY
jgi:acyl carrier protein